ncbi:MAG TPA: phenylacetate--CoA ligase family protein [Polyangiaceae bacterium]|jgi:phenylacetate-CoA ligase
MRTRSATEALRDFTATSLDEAIDRAGRIDSREAALALFRDVAERVPAYGAFVREKGIDPAKVARFEDFERLPLVDKPGYVTRYELAARCWDGKLAACDRVSVSSGSTGQPTFWPRALADELVVARRFEQVFVDAFRAHERSTLAVICFPLGTWVGGIYTSSACRHLASLRGMPITTVTPGNQKDEILRVAFGLGPMFEQTVLLGYPPFLKEVVDLARARGLDLAKLSPKLVLAGEVVTEEWRTLVAERLGGADVLTSFASLYGTADAGVLGVETPLAIALRRFFAARPEESRALFGAPRMPTLVQYDPTARFFETRGGTLLFSGDGGAPLVRYHIADEGGLFGYDELVARAAKLGFDPAVVRASGAPEPRRQPFAYVFGRSHFVVSFFGANIYPENVAVGLEQPGVREHVTGKFVLSARETADRDRVLALAVELAPGVTATKALREAIAASVATHVARLNSEFAGYVPEERKVPEVDLRAAADPELFPAGVKHRYTR